ncbi:MAG: ERCC4 domain-containing protein [Candidatus Subteraquimicrobiales bacterium]|nr:ERCC4 domain-containing protein [Candidatus Subteraquimicrobiales bacterium]
MDSREPDHVIKEARKRFKTLEVSYLKVGDFVCGDVCIERKALSDFVGSVNSKRMYNQAANMGKNYAHNFIIIIGREKELEDKRFFNFSARRFRREIAFLMANYNVKILLVENDNAFYDQVYQLFKQFAEKTDNKKNEIMRIAPRSGDVYVDMICVVDRIGPVKAREILKHFKVCELFDISEKDLSLSVKGVGKTQAAQIKKVFRR